MDKKILLTALALAVTASLGYAAYSNGSMADLGSVINSRLSGVVSVGSDYLAALATTTQKVGGTAERKAKTGSSLSVSIGSTPKAQTILAASRDVTLANYVLDTSKSDKSLTVEMMKLTLSFSKNASPDDLINCRLGGAALESSLVSSTSKEFIVRNLVLAKGVKSSLPLNCDVATNPKSAVGSTFAWGIKGKADSMVVKDDTGVIFAVKVANAKNHNATIRNAGDLGVAFDSVSSKARNVSCGSSMPMSGLKFSAKYEDIRINSINFKVGGSAGATVVKKVSVSDSLANVLGEGVFSNGGMSYSTGEVTINLNQQFVVPKDGSKKLYITPEISGDSACQNLKNKTIAVDFNGANATGVVSASAIGLKNKVSAPRNTIR